MAASRDAQDAWAAVGMTGPVGRESPVEVSGTVAAVVTDRMFLQMAKPRGIDPADLIPGLVVRRREPGGGSASGPREVHPAHEIPSRRYAAVRRDAAVVAHVTVEEVLS